MAAPSPEADAASDYAARSYDERYFAERVGHTPYHRGNPVWESLFANAADVIVAELAPTSVLDAGCAIGFLVEALRARGVDAQGVDVSEYAISQVPAELRPFCRVGSITDELDRDFDLIVCIEVLEHLPAEHAHTAVANLARHAPAVFFSSTPDDFTEPTHLNVRPPEYWAGLFARHGFFRDFGFDGSFLAPQAVLFRRTGQTAPEVARDYEREYARLLSEVRALRGEVGRLTERLDATHAGAAEANSEPFIPRRPRAVRAARALAPVGDRVAPTGSVRHRALRKVARATAVGRRVERLVRPLSLDDQYQLWLAENELTPERLDALRGDAASLANRPLVSILMPVHDTPPPLLRAAVESVEAQAYDQWELCIADDASSHAGTREALTAAASDQRVKLRRLDETGGIAAATNAALELATGELVGFLDHDDELKPDALFEVVRLLNEQPHLDYVYSDEDKRDANGHLVEPFFKPDWSPDLELSINYVTHFSVYRRELLSKLGGLRSGFDGSQDYDLALRATELTDRVGHVRRPLYTWRKTPGSAAASTQAKPYAYEAAKRALAEAVARRGLDATVEDGPGPGSYRVRYRVGEVPAEVIRVEREATASALNRAAESVKGGTVIVFLAEDLEPVASDWLEALLEHAQRPGVAAVGPRLLGPAGVPEHEGVVVGVDGSAQPVATRGYFSLGEFVRNVSGVSSACFATRREVFDRLGGFDTRFDGTLAVADYCLRAAEGGDCILYTPYSVLRRRGKKRRPSSRGEAEFRRRWLSETLTDPYYNPNLSLRRPYELRVGAERRA